ncbi:hypothetical protein JCM8097_004161 [Rhodosporidiobolus ruineniae]
MSTATASASLAPTGAYVPPGATTTAAAVASKSASYSFAAVAGTGTGTATATQTAAVADATGGVDSSSLLEYFTRPYLDAHTLSLPTWRYAYILWFVIVGTLILWSAVYHLARFSSGGSALGAWFRKWSIRRITWTKTVGGSEKGGKQASQFGLDQTGVQEGGAARTRKKVVWASPTLAQTIPLVVLVAAALCVSFIGDDYIAPTTCTFGGECGYQAYGASSSPPKSNYKRGVNNPNGWAPFNDPLLASSNHNIGFNAWSAAARLGLIAFAMLPLAITLALKQWPFNIWATPFLTNYHFDKTAILHRWSGRVIWLFSTGHAIGWFWQLGHDKDPFLRPVLVPIWAWYRFQAGAAAWVLLTILTAFSFKPIRNRFYEFFYWSHVVLVIGTLVACIIHHPPLLWWPLIALIWWGAERLFRFAHFLWINGILEGIWFREPARSARSSLTYAAGQEKADGFSDVKLGSGGQGGDYPPLPFDESSEPLNAPGMSRQGSYSAEYPPSPSLPLDSSAAPTYRSSPLYASTTSSRFLPPPGFASAQLLPGRTIRLTVHVPHTIRWSPGQHLLLNIPEVRPLDSHPYTIACVDERSEGLTPLGKVDVKKGSEVVLLIRAQKGFSKALWDFVVRKRRADGPHSAAGGAPGVNLRALVSSPMGSTGRVSWGGYESLLIVAGGTGISYAMAVLQNACRRMARREEDPKWRTTRVRFVWIMREFAHLSWVASTLRQCIEMCDSSQLQVDLFVTHDAPKRPSRRQPPSSPFADDLAPPSAPFARAGGARGSVSSDLSDLSDGENSPTSSRFQLNQHGAEAGEEVESVTDFVLFDGEDDYRTAGEAEVSAKIKKQGKLRRALSRRGQGGSLRRPGNAVAPSTTAPYPAQPQQQQQHHYSSPFASDSTASFQALPLDDSPQPPHSASFGDIGAANRAASFDYGGSQYGFDDGRSDAGTLVNNATSSTHNLVKHAAGSSSRPNSRGDLASLAGLGGTSTPASMAKLADHDPDEAFFLDVTAAEQDDLDAVAELAKTGYPRLREILDDEVERSQGKTLVACCGPSGLNTVVRNLVAKKIDLKRVARGDPRGHVGLTVEDFDF